MTNLELYHEIGKWINRYHRYDWYRTGLLKDFQHDLYIKLLGRDINVSYIKQSCYHYPLNAVSRYYNWNKDYTQREIVMLNEDGSYLEFAADPEPTFEFTYEQPKTVNKYRKHHDVKKVRVTYITGKTEDFNSVREFAETINVNTRSVYKYIGTELKQRTTKRKMSHIRIINYL